MVTMLNDRVSLKTFNDEYGMGSEFGILVACSLGLNAKK